MPSDAAITGWAALRWQGGSWFDGLLPGGAGERPVTIASCDQDIRIQPGFEVCQERLNPVEIVDVDGLRITIPRRSVCFEMRYAKNLRAAVGILDMAAYDDLVSIAELTDYALAHPGWTGIPQARDAIPLADENSWSPRETDMRLLWRINAGLPRPLCNRPVFDLQGQHVGTPDLLDAEAGVAGEYDSALHLTGQQRAVDVRRESVFRDHGLETFSVVTEDMGDRTRVVNRMIAARARAQQQDRPREWTITRPNWWTPSHTVEQRRALTGHTRDAVLKRRRRSA